MNHYFLSHIQINKNHIKLYVCKNNLLIDNIGIVTKKNNSVKITIYDKKLNFWLKNKLNILNTFADNIIMNYLKCKLIDVKNN
jgi:hypothetical protein